MRNSTSLRFLVCWIALVACAGGLGVWPKLSAIRRHEAKAQELATMIRESDDVNAQIGLLSEWRAEIHRRVSTSTTPIPAESDVAGLMRDLTRTLVDLGITEREITTGSAVESEESFSLPLSVTMRGRFPRVMEAVRWIENLPRLVRVRRIKIERSRDWTPDEPVVTAELLVDVFFAPHPIDTSSDLSVFAGVEKGGRR